MRLWNGCLGLQCLPSCFSTKVSKGLDYKALRLKMSLKGARVTFQLISSTLDTVSISQEGCARRNAGCTGCTSCVLVLSSVDCFLNASWWHPSVVLSLILSKTKSSLFSCTVFVYCPQVVSDAAGQGVTITGNKTFNNWNWPNAVIFAATVITTIGKFFWMFDSWIYETDAGSLKSWALGCFYILNVFIFTLKFNLKGAPCKLRGQLLMTPDRACLYQSKRWDIQSVLFVVYVMQPLRDRAEYQHIDGRVYLDIVKLLISDSFVIR